MVNSLLSPCLYLENNELKNLGELIEVLDFISRFLDVNIDLSNLSILCEDNWYSFPKYKPTIYNQFATCVVPLFKKLKNRVIINQAINKNIKQPIHLEYLQEIHELVARFDVEYQYLGKWRTDDVLISGTNWRPKCPDVKKMHFELNRYLDNPFITDRAIRTGL